MAVRLNLSCHLLRDAVFWREMTLTIRVIHEIHFPGSPETEVCPLQAIHLKLDKIIMNETEFLAKLDELKTAAADERTEVLASLAAIKALITEKDFTAAAAKVDEAIAAVKGIHEADDDAV